MLKDNVHLILFFLFAMGLPLWAMDINPFQQGSVHGCADSCYEEWKTETGGFLAVAAAKAEAAAAAGN